MASLITSLRFIATFDWSDFFEGVSLVEQVLQRDPAGVYSQMDFRSRDRYRHAVEAGAADGRRPAVAGAQERRARAASARAHSRRSRHARGLSLDRPRPTGVRAQRRLAARQASRPPVVLCLGNANLPREHRRRRSCSPGRRLRRVAWLAGCRAGVRGTARGRAGERARHPAAAATDQLPDSAAALARIASSRTCPRRRARW